MLSLDDIIIDPEFRDFLPALEERDRLAAKIELEGWTDEPITVWQHHNILLDGHNRYAIWKDRGDDGPPVREMKFASREAAFYWVVNNQCARRNLTPEQQKYLLGRKYTAEKKLPGGDGTNQYRPKEELPHFEEVPLGKGNNATAKRLGKELGVSHSTVERAENYADAVDDLDKRGVVAKSDILSGKVKLPANRLIEAAKAETPEKAKTILDTARTASAKPVRERRPEIRDTTYKLDTDRARQVANKNYQRLGIIFGQTQAIADGIESVNLDAAMSVLRPSDADAWVEYAKRTIASLKSLSSRLKTEAERVERSQVQEAEDGVDHGGEADG